MLLVGVAVCDIIAVVPRIAEPGGIVYVENRFTISVGGHPCNISAALTKLGYEPGKVRVVASIGGDMCGRLIEETLRGYGIATAIHRVEGMSSGMNVILVVEGEDRRFHLDVGACPHLPLNHVLNVLEGAKPGLLHIAPGLLGEVDSNLSTVLEKSRSLGALNMVDVGAAKPYRGTWSFLLNTLGLVDVLHCNTYEMQQVFGTGNVAEAARTAIRRGVRIFVVTDGDRGAYVSLGNTLIHQPAFRVESVDPTGAGDCFQAAFILKLLEVLGKSAEPREGLETLTPDQLAEVLLYAQAAGALATMAPGALGALRADLLEMLIGEQRAEVMARTRITEL